MVHTDRSDGMPTTKVPRPSSPAASPPSEPTGFRSETTEYANTFACGAKPEALRDRLLGWVVAAKSATAGRTGRARAKLRAIWAFGSTSSLTQLVLGSPKNHLRSGGSKFFMVNWPCCLMVFGQGALFATAQVNFPEEGAERSRPPKGQPPIRPGGLTRARERPAGGSANRAVIVAAR